jgi:hypothetical protein
MISIAQYQKKKKKRERKKKGPGIRPVRIPIHVFKSAGIGSQ